MHQLYETKNHGNERIAPFKIFKIQKKMRFINYYVKSLMWCIYFTLGADKQALFSSSLTPPPFPACFYKTRHNLAQIIIKIVIFLARKQIFWELERVLVTLNLNNTAVAVITQNFFIRKEQITSRCKYWLTCL